MYQLGTIQQLWELSETFSDEIDQITLRGYNEYAPIPLPADFFGKDTRRLSVEKVARDFCPIRRDLYLEIRLRRRSQRSVWGQTAGRLIESYFKTIFVHFLELSKNPVNLTYQKIEELSQAYSTEFWQDKEKDIRTLERKATTSSENPEKLKYLLKQTTKYELSMLTADKALRNREKPFIPITEKLSIGTSEPDLKIEPHSSLGLSAQTTPDFLINQPVIIIGEVKSGRSIQPYHLTAVTGYALAYESQYRVPVNFGAVYFFETHNSYLNFAQTHIFVITDFERRKFLDKRDAAYAILLGDEPKIDGEFQDKYYENICKNCKYLSICYSDG